LLVRRAARPPEVTLMLRAAFVLLMVASVFLVFLVDRDGLRDQIDGHVSVSDIFEIRRGQRRIGCWADPTLRIEAGDRVIVIDANDGR